MRVSRAIHRSMAAVIGVVLMIGALAVALVTTAAPAQASSSLGGRITRSEVLARAAYWYTHNPVLQYSEGHPDDTWDVNHTREYRRDCSGMIDMAWHLDADPPTYQLSDSTYSTQLSTWSQLLPGDILDDDADGDDHAVLFAGWTDSTHFNYYSFGSTPMKYANTSITGDADGNISGHPYGRYLPYRYVNIVNDLDAGLMADFNGDGKPDIAAMNSTGDELYITLNATTTNGVPVLAATSQHVSNGWATVKHLMAVDFDGDGRADLIGVSGDALYLWRNTTPIGGTTISFAAHITLSATGNSTVSRFLAPADYNADGRPDIAAFDSGGDTLYITANTSAPGIPSVGSPELVSSGWKTVDHMMTTDFDGDGKADILGRSGNSLLLWRSTSSGAAFSFANHTTLSTGNSSVTKYLGPADFDGDGKPDIAAFNSTGDGLYLTRNTSTPGHPSVGAGSLVSSGWKTVDDMMVGDTQSDGKADIWGRDGDGLLEWSSTSTSTSFSFAAYDYMDSGNANVSNFLTLRPVA